MKYLGRKIEMNTTENEPDKALYQKKNPQIISVLRILLYNLSKRLANNNFYIVGIAIVS